jgi:indole-3-glycerol phosphate synthase
VNELQRIVARTREELAARIASRPRAELRLAAAARLRDDPPRGFAAALTRDGLSVIAEHKRRSPSAGLIREDLALEDVVGAYARGGARALSVLTERDGFGGTLEDLARARAACRLPILRKDFMVDRYQVDEAVAGGADAILLIVAALPDATLRELHDRASHDGLDVLVEVHDAAELERAVALGARVIGINNRDLTTLRVDPERTFELRGSVPPDVITVSESGLRDRAMLDRVAAAGIDAVLVGESLMRAGDVEAACRALTTRSGRGATASGGGAARLQ